MSGRRTTQSNLVKIKPDDECGAPPEFVAVAEAAGEACRLANSGVARIGRTDLLPLGEGGDEHLQN
jgi:hypothetical protein